MADAVTKRGMPAGKKPMALVLQGGGALGAHEWGAIIRLCEAGFYPIAVTGVSIGAVNAAAIAGAKDGDIIASLNELWRRLICPCRGSSPMPWRRRCPPWDTRRCTASGMTSIAPARAG